MPERRNRLPQMLTPQQPLTTPPQATQAVVLLPLLDECPNRTFLHYDQTTAGRAVILELYPPKFVGTNEVKHLMHKHHADDEAELGRRMGIWRRGTPLQAAWKRFQGRVDFEELGRGAQRLEDAGYNWRQARDHEEILQEVKLLPKDATN